VKRAALALVAALSVPAAAQEALPPDAADLSLDPDRAVPGLSSERGRAVAEAVRVKDYETAEKLLVEAVQDEQASAELLRLFGSVSFLRGQYLNAAIAFKKAERKAPLDERSRFTLAMAYVVLGRRDWARPELETLSRSAPRNALYVYWTGRLHYDDGRYAAAIEAFRQAIALDPLLARAHDNLGLCYEALGRYDEALASFREAVRLNREADRPSPWPPLNLGLLLMRLDRPGKAEPLFREAVQVDPRFAQGRYQLGVALEKAGHTTEAIAELEQAAQLDGSYAEPHYALARVYRRVGRTADAERELRTFQQLKDTKRKAGPANR
jgi:tetratricopeptide (TPR) repeat protein